MFLVIKQAMVVKRKQSLIVQNVQKQRMQFIVKNLKKVMIHFIVNIKINIMKDKNGLIIFRNPKHNYSMIDCTKKQIPMPAGFIMNMLGKMAREAGVKGILTIDILMKARDNYYQTASVLN
jgi:hypothetical protein